MTQSRSVCSRIRNARASLDNAERSFRSNQEVRGELDLMLFLDPSYAGGLFCCSGAGLRMFGLVVGFCVWRKHHECRRITGTDNCR